MIPEDGKRRPAVEPSGELNPGEEFNLSLASPPDIPGLTPAESRILHNWIADANGVPARRIAYVAVVEIADGKYRRRPYLTLAGAQAAVERAEARGVTARVTLCELRPIGDTP